MKPTKHTPAPWNIYGGHPRQPIEVIGDGCNVARVMSPKAHDYPKSFKERMANARLISAAPDMLAALQGLLGCTVLDTIEQPDVVMDRVLRATEKAEE